jgi:CheY-like chemotaxis protein
MQNQTILLAEDEENDVFFMQRAFDKAGIKNQLQVVSDGDEVLHYLAGEGVYADRETYPFPALLILDLKMPKKTGFEVLEAIQRHPRYETLPIVVQVTCPDHPDLEKAYRLGASSFLIKPISYDRIVELMIRIQGSWNVPKVNKE